MPSARILVSGSSGPIGIILLHVLNQNGYEVTRLVRGAVTGERQIAWDPLKPLSPASVSGFDSVVHLAGESIVGRWTDAKKRRMMESRKQGTSHLSEAIAQAEQRPRTLISASAIGYYGNRGDEILREDSSSGSGFAAELCRVWEGATQVASQAGIRVVHARFGVVQSPDGGSLQKMLPPFRMGLGGKVGDGRQWFSWIHVNDVAGAVLNILKNDSLHGPVNIVSPKPVTNAEFTQALGSVLSRPTIFPMPAFAARLAFGQMADELLLASQRVEPAQLIASGYSFQYADVRKALEEILK